MLREVLGLGEVLEWARRYNGRLASLRYVSAAALPRPGPRLRNAKADAVAAAAARLGVWPHVFVRFLAGDRSHIYPDPQYLPRLDVPALVADVDCGGEEALLSCRDLFLKLYEALGLPYPEGLPRALKVVWMDPEALSRLPPPPQEDGEGREAVRPEEAGQPGPERRLLEKAAALLAAGVPPATAAKLAEYVSSHEKAISALEALLHTPPDRALQALQAALAAPQSASAAQPSPTERPSPPAAPQPPPELVELWREFGDKLLEAVPVFRRLMERPGLRRLLEDAEALEALGLLAADVGVLELLQGLAELRRRDLGSYRRLLRDFLKAVAEV